MQQNPRRSRSARYSAQTGACSGERVDMLASDAKYRFGRADIRTAADLPNVETMYELGR